MGRITNYDKKVWNTYKQALTPKLSVTRGTGVASVSVSDGLKSFANGDLITIGDTYTITATPSSGYAHSALLINGVVKANPATVTITDNQFSVVAQASDILFDLAVVGNHMTLSVVDGEIEYSAGANVLPLGAEVVITATNDVGYEVTGITVNGEPFTNGDTLVVSTNTEIEVVVAELSHDLTITKDANCTVTVMYGEDELVAGEDAIPNSAPIVITATADIGYSIASLTINGTAFTSGESIVATEDIAIVVTAVELFDIAITGENCTITILDSELNEYSAGTNVVANGKVLTISVTASEGYEVTAFTVNSSAFESGTTHTVAGDVTIVATTQVASGDIEILVGEIDFNTNSTWDSENEMYFVDTVPELDFSSIADGDVNLKITVTLDGTPMTIKGRRHSTEDFVVIGDLFDTYNAIVIASGVKIGVMEGIGENVDSIVLLAPENYLLTHTVVLNSIEIDENIEEILSADISYAWNSGDSKFEGTITTQTLDVSGLTNEQDNIYTYWEIDDTKYLVTRYLVQARSIINGTTTSLQESALLDSIAITLDVNAKIIDTDGTLTTEITGSALTGNEVITLLAVFIQNSPT